MPQRRILNLLLVFLTTIKSSDAKHTIQIENSLKSIVHTIGGLFVHSVVKIERTFSPNIELCAHMDIKIVIK